nr:hypothetical protein MFMH1_34690 [Myxococcus sp. MH1]
MASYQWNDGHILTLSQGDTASCAGGLNKDLLHALFFYNSAQNETGATLTVVWKTSEAPVTVRVPGTNAKQGLASLFFVSGDDTNSVSVGMSNNQPGAQVQCFIGSVKMPTNTTGLNNTLLEADGKLHPLKTFTRYHTAPQPSWYQGQLQSNVNQFMSVQFTSKKATVNLVNSQVEPTSAFYYATSRLKDLVQINRAESQTLQWNLQGNGEQVVWINATSLQNSQTASIALQSLASLYKLVQD